MVTKLMAGVGAIGVAFIAACSGRSTSPEPPSGHAIALPPDTVEPGGTGPQYPGTGFRVHEWGTNTIVVGSDGSLQRGLQHEEEDLPSFVYDRRRAELAQDPVEVKMETPVTYFYSDTPMKTDVTVRFPHGVLTQWYPAVQSFAPLTLKGKGDPALDPRFPFTNAACREQFSRLRDGVLAWGSVDVLARDAQPSVPEAPLDRFTWSHARAVGANAIRVANGAAQDERFLFYRGLGNFPIDVKVAAQAGEAGRDGGLTLTNLDANSAVGAVFVLRVEQDKAAFTVRSGGIAAGASLAETAPRATQPLDAYANDLAKAMVKELDAAGLYHDESIAMVKTWARQWFRTPGVRVLYLAPQAWTDRQIPLDVAPKPAELVRVMVIRVEALTRAQEDADVAAVAKLAGAARAEGEAHFRGLGRFAEPRLRRAITLADAPLEATQLLDAMSGADVNVRAGE
ncbi:MAG: hypothetical protein KF819_22245 [Labilithrix sp.]|nr:hypothetical protein [Labilithrix sp.]